MHGIVHSGISLYLLSLIILICIPVINNIGLVDQVVPQALSDQDWRAVSLAFLQPYLSMPYPKSVRAIKQAVGSAEGGDSGSAIQLEQQMFHERWFSQDNQEAIAKATKKK
ncbi:hypothetical protein EON65_20150 [archaeon]|nr:MAG: hypothetical protein EON65_20150 [archaeon]